MASKTTQEIAHTRETEVAETEDARYRTLLELGPKAYALHKDGDPVGAILIAPSVSLPAGSVLRDLTVISFEVGTNKFGKYPILMVKFELDGILMIGRLHAGSKVLRDQLKELNIQPGDVIAGVASMGPVLDDQGALKYYLWKVVQDGNNVKAFDWSAF